MFSFKIETYECKHSNFRFWNFKIFCKVWFFFFTMKSSDGEGLWQLYLELVDANNIYSSKWASRCIKMLSIWKRMRRHFKILLELKLKFIPNQSLEMGSYGSPDPPSKLFIGNRDSNSTFVFCFCLNLTNGLVA